MTGGSNRCTILMNPDDAASRGLADGEIVCVASAIGRIEVPVDVTADIRAGTVAIPHGWGHRDTGWRHADTLAGAKEARASHLSRRASSDRRHSRGAVSAMSGSSAVH